MNNNSNPRIRIFKGLLAAVVCLLPVLSSNWESILAQVYPPQNIQLNGVDSVTWNIQIDDGDIGATGGSQAFTYLWTGDGISGPLSGPAQSIELDSPAPGEDPIDYNIELTVTDSFGESHTQDFAITVSGQKSDTLITELPGYDGEDPNRRSTAAGVEAVCPELGRVQNRTAAQENLFEVCSAILFESDDSERLVAIDALTGDQIAAQQTNSVDISGLQMRNIAGRLRAVREGSRGVSVAGLGFNVDGKYVSAAVLQDMLENIVGGAAGEAGLNSRWGLFLNGNISFGDKDDTVLETGFDFDTYGITAGFDYRFSNNMFAGLAIGYGSSESDFNFNGGELESEGYTLSGFTSYNVDNVYVDAIASIGRSDHDSDRNIIINTSSLSISEIARGSTDGDQMSLGIESGINFENDGWVITPNVTALYSDVDIDGFAENGANGLGLFYGDQGIESLTLSAGLAAAYNYSTSWGVLRPNFRADFVRELEDDAQLINVRFASDPFTDDPSVPAAPITITTEAPDKDYFLLGIGVSAQFQSGLSGFIDWQSLQGYDDLQVDSVTFGVRWEASF